MTTPNGKAPRKEGQLEDELDEALDETFPASDPIAVTPEDDDVGQDKPREKKTGRRDAG